MGDGAGAGAATLRSSTQFMAISGRKLFFRLQPQIDKAADARISSAGLYKKRLNALIIEGS